VSAEITIEQSPYGPIPFCHIVESVKSPDVTVTNLPSIGGSPLKSAGSNYC
jgi:hypothetical protein